MKSGDREKFVEWGGFLKGFWRGFRGAEVEG